MKEKEPITVELSTKEKCYSCSRTAADIDLIFDPDQIKSLIIQASGEQNSQIEAELKAYMKSLEELYSATKSYQGNITTRELSHNSTLAEKIAPRYSELWKYAEERHGMGSAIPGYGDNYTIDELRGYLKKRLLELKRRDFLSLKKDNPNLAEKIQWVVTPDLSAFKTYKMVKFVACQMVKYFDLKGKEFIRDDSRYGIPNDVIRINLTYHLCPICAAAFSAASRAASSEIHKNDDD